MDCQINITRLNMMRQYVISWHQIIQNVFQIPYTRRGRTVQEHSKLYWIVSPWPDSSDQTQVYTCFFLCLRHYTGIIHFLRRRQIPVHPSNRSCKCKEEDYTGLYQPSRTKCSTNSDNDNICMGRNRLVTGTSLNFYRHFIYLN